MAASKSESAYLKKRQKKLPKKTYVHRRYTLPDLHASRLSPLKQHLASGKRYKTNWRQPITTRFAKIAPQPVDYTCIIIHDNRSVAPQDTTAPRPSRPGCPKPYAHHMA